MGTGFSIDTPLRVAHLGIDSVISLVDDLLIERVHRHYAEKHEIEFNPVSTKDPDARSHRITGYLDLIHDLVLEKVDQVRSMSLFEENEKRRYFELLPDGTELKEMFHKVLEMTPGLHRDTLEQELTDNMQTGSIDVNIMVKLDRLNTRGIKSTLSDAQAALKGFAESTLESSIVFSAGINQRMFRLMTQFKDFYRDETGKMKKKIVIKVSDFRSAFNQAKFLARLGLEVDEYRIESGLNCGGHAFASPGHLLPTILKEFKEKRDELKQMVMPIVQRYYEKMGWEYHNDNPNPTAITVQGGIGNKGEADRLIRDYGMDRTGWATPFLLVPEVTRVDASTRNKLVEAGEDDLYLSRVSPVGIPFNNLRGSGSELWHQQRIDEGRPGSPCPKGILISDTEFTEEPICTASTEYQGKKLIQIEQTITDPVELARARKKVLAKSCICDHLGNGTLIDLEITRKKSAPQSICPGPNLAWFDRQYSLEEMVDHIYGRGPSLTPPDRLHMFAKELQMYVDYFADMVEDSGNSEKELAELEQFHSNLQLSIDLCAEIADGPGYPGENLTSIRKTIAIQRPRLAELYESLTVYAE